MYCITVQVKHGVGAFSAGNERGRFSTLHQKNAKGEADQDHLSILCLFSDLLRWYPIIMQITVELPDEMARQMIPAGDDPARTALEDMAVEAYRAHRLTEYQLATLLGMGRYELDGFLKRREVWLEYTTDDLRQEVEAGERLWKMHQQELATTGK